MCIMCGEKNWIDRSSRATAQARGGADPLQGLWESGWGEPLQPLGQWRIHQFPPVSTWIWESSGSESMIFLGFSGDVEIYSRSGNPSCLGPLLKLWWSSIHLWGHSTNKKHQNCWKALVSIGYLSNFWVHGGWLTHSTLFWSATPFSLGLDPNYVIFPQSFVKSPNFLVLKPPVLQVNLY